MTLVQSKVSKSSAWVFAVSLGFLPGFLLGCKDEPKIDRAAAPSSGGTSGVASANSVGSAAPSNLINATPLPSAAIAVMLGADKLPAYTGPTGSIEGTVSVVGDPPPDAKEQNFAKCPAAAKAYGKLFREGPPVEGGEPGARGLADALVGVTGYSGFYVPERNEAKKVTIEDCALTPRTVDMTFGQRLEIANKTNLLFAPSLSGVFSPALMAAPPGGDPVKIYPQRPGYFQLSDKLGNEFFRGDVYVLLHPLHTVSGVDGRYRMDGLPLGKVTVFSRLNVIGETAKEIEVLSGVVARVDLTLKYAPKDAGTPAPAASTPKGDAGKPQNSIH